MKLKTYALLVFLFVMFPLMAQLSPKREFRGAWMHTVSGHYKGMGTAEMQKLLIEQLNSLQEAGYKCHNIPSSSGSRCTLYL